MSVSSYMSAQLGQLQQTVGLAMLKSIQSTQAAGAVVMLEDFRQTQQQVQAPHPNLGNSLDILV